MIKISLKGFAKFMVANSSGQRKILEDFKYPDQEGLVQAVYYKEAMNCIKSYHRNNRPEDWIEDKADALRVLAAQASGRTISRLQNNARAIQQYYNILERRSLKY